MNRETENTNKLTQTESVLPATDTPAGIRGKECFQYAEKYIVTPGGGGIMVIDQHRAHLKILYEKCLRDIARMEVTSQRILFPEFIELDMEQQNALAKVSAELTQIGFALEYESDSRWSIAAVPSMISRGDAREVVLRILDSVREESPDYGVDSNPIDDMMQRMALVLSLIHI